MDELEIWLRPIGRVSNEVVERGRREWENIVSEISISPEWGEAMEGVDDFSHLIVLFWLHRVSAEERARTLRVHPGGRSDIPARGVFATRSPVRPNPIGMCVVRLLERKGNVLKVRGLDAVNETPVLDIKPYLPSDQVSEATVPQWVIELRGS